MKKSMKKITTLILVMAMALSLTACGDKASEKKDKPVESSNTQKEDTQSKPEATEEPAVVEADPTTPDEGTEETTLEEDGVLKSWGGALLYNPEKWEKTNMGLGAKDSEAEIVFMPYGYTVQEMVENREMNASDFVVEDITVNGNSAKKILYTSGWSPNSTKLSIVIDTAYLNDDFSKVFNIELTVKKDTAEEELLDDPEVWDMINSFYTE